MSQKPTRKHGATKVKDLRWARAKVDEVIARAAAEVAEAVLMQRAFDEVTRLQLQREQQQQRRNPDSSSH